MPPAAALFPLPGYHHLLAASQSPDNSSETWFTRFKKTLFSESWIQNSVYLAPWAMASAANSAFNALDSHDKDTAQLVSSVFVVAAVVIDILGTQSGGAAITLRDKYLASLQELVTAAESGVLTDFELAEKAAKCAKDLQAAEALPGWSEVIPKIGTDAIAGINSLMQQVNTYITIANNRSVAEGLSDVLIDKQDSVHTLPETSELIDSKEASGTHTITEPIDEPETNIAPPSDLIMAINGIGIVTGLANCVRGIAELSRLYQTAKSHAAKIQITKNGITELNGGVGTAVLTHIKTATTHRKAANFWSMVGAIFRIGNGLWGIASKIVFFTLGAVIAPWIAPLVAAVVLLTYFIKGWMHAHQARAATRLDNLLSNTVKVLSKVGSEPYEKYLKPELVKDLKALAQGGRALWNFLKALGKTELFTEVRKRLGDTSSIKERFPLIRKVIDICTTPTDIVRQALRKSKDADAAKIAERIPGPDFQAVEERENLDEAIQTSENESLPGHFEPLKRFTADEEKMFQKFMSGSMEKAIAASAGELPGWRFSAGKKEDVKKMSVEFIKACAEDTSETDLLLQILEGLNANHKTRNSKLGTFFKIIVKSRTWSLTRHAKDLEHALEAKDATKLATSTLAAALTPKNVRAIAQCRFKDRLVDQEVLVKLLDENPNFSEIKAIAKAIENSNGEKLLKASRGKSFQKSLKTTLMLFGYHGEHADHITKTLCSDLRPSTSTALADDLINALNIMIGKQIFAKIGNEALWEQVRQHLLLFGARKFVTSKSRQVLLVTDKVSSTDPRLHQYIDGIATGKIPFDAVPERFLSMELRNTLGQKAPKGALRGVLRDQLQLGFECRDQRQTPVALNWPAAEFYGKTDQERHDNLRYSFSEMLGIDADASTLSEMLEAAAIYRKWSKNKTLPDIKSIIQEGGIKAAVALHCVTDLTGILLVDKSAIARLNAAEDLDQIKNICLEIIASKTLGKKESPSEDGPTNENETTRPDIRSARRRSMAILSNTKALLERDPGNEEGREGDGIGFVVVNDGLRQRRQNSDVHAGLLREIARKRACSRDPIAGEDFQERRSEEEEEAMPVGMEIESESERVTNRAGYVFTTKRFGRHSVKP